MFTFDSKFDFIWKRKLRNKFHNLSPCVIRQSIFFDLTGREKMALFGLVSQGNIILLKLE